MASDRAQEDRRLPALAEQPNGRVDLAHINETTGSNLIAIEAFPVRANRAAIVTAGRQPRPMPRWQLGSRDRLEVEDGQRLGSGRNQVAISRCRGGLGRRM